MNELPNCEICGHAAEKHLREPTPDGACSHFDPVLGSTRCECPVYRISGISGAHLIEIDRLISEAEAAAEPFVEAALSRMFIDQERYLINGELERGEPDGILNYKPETP